MEITTFQTEEKDGTLTEHIRINLGDGAFITMLKSEYDAQQEAAELGGTL